MHDAGYQPRRRQTARPVPPVTPAGRAGGGGEDRSWSTSSRGLRVRPAGRGYPVTELRGALRDQAALFGVLATLYDLGLPLLSVDCRAPRSSVTG